MTSHNYSVSPKYKNKNATYENKDNQTQDHIETFLKINKLKKQSS